MNSDEAQFILDLQNQQAQAFKILLKTYQNKVYNTCMGLVQSEADAQDIAQEVFVEVYQSIAQFKGNSKLSTWIYRITLSKVLDFLRKRKRKKRFGVIYSLFKPENNEISFEQSDFIHPGIALENQELSATLFKAIEQLPENQKSAFVLHKLEDLSYQEIAEVLQISLSSVESLMFRAKQNLKKLLANYYKNLD